MQKKRNFHNFYNHVNLALLTGINYSNSNKILKLNKITLVANIVPYAYDKTKIEIISEELFSICNQKPTLTKAKKSIASLSVRAGVPVSLLVTLRGNKMYSFLEKCLHFAFPRIRDFTGFSLKSFDKQGNYTIFIKDKFVFPEIEYNELDITRGYTIICSTNLCSRYKSFLFLKKIGLPFANSQ